MSSREMGRRHVMKLHPEKLVPFARAFAALPALLVWPAKVQAQFNYTTNSGAITITGYTGPGGDVTIPDTITGLPVTKIGFAAFSSRSTLTNVFIPGSVTNIGNYAFGSCANLSAISVDALNSL